MLVLTVSLCFQRAMVVSAGAGRRACTLRGTTVSFIDDNAFGFFTLSVTLASSS
jgi:hypothetical protein